MNFSRATLSEVHSRLKLVWKTNFMDFTGFSTQAAWSCAMPNREAESKRTVI